MTFPTWFTLQAANSNPELPEAEFDAIQDAHADFSGWFDSDEEADQVGVSALLI